MPINVIKISSYFVSWNTNSAGLFVSTVNVIYNQPNDIMIIQKTFFRNHLLNIVKIGSKKVVLSEKSINIWGMNHVKMERL